METRIKAILQNIDLFRWKTDFECNTDNQFLYRFAIFKSKWLKRQMQILRNEPKDFRVYNFLFLPNVCVFTRKEEKEIITLYKSQMKQFNAIKSI